MLRGELRPTFRAFAHRGGAQERPENSLAAFQHAVDLGFVDLELDVRGTKDGVAVVHHDATLNRTTDRVGRLNDLTWPHVARARIHGRFPIMRLEELLARLPTTHLTVDAKDAMAVSAITAALASLSDPGRVTVTSFSARRLKALRRDLPVSSAAHPGEVWRVWRSSRRGTIPQIEGQSLAVPKRIGRRTLLTPQFIHHAHSMGLPVYAWTINSETDMQALIELGIDGIMTDRPTLLRHVLRRNDLWSNE
jgi:glycerophosphoryl diester phosphodiesterase